MNPLIEKKASRHDLKEEMAQRLAVMETARVAGLTVKDRLTPGCSTKASQGWQCRAAALVHCRWARRNRLEPFKKLATTLKDRMPGVIRGMLDGRSNAYVEAMNGMFQQVERAVRGSRTVKNFVAIAYLRMAKLKNLPPNPMRPAAPLRFTIYRAGRPFPLKMA